MTVHGRESGFRFERGATFLMERRELLDELCIFWSAIDFVDVNILAPKATVRGHLDLTQVAAVAIGSGNSHEESFKES